MARRIHTLLNSRTGQVSALAIMAMALAAPAHSQATHLLHIPAGTLDAALQALATQSHEQLLYTPALVAGRTSPAVDGDLTSEQALVRMHLTPDILVARTGPSMLVLRQASGFRASPTAIHQVTPSSEQAAPGPFVAETGTPAAVQSLPIGKADADVRAASTVSEIQVTGTHIRGGQTSSPMLVVSRSDLERSGQVTVAEALRALPENFGGGAGEGNTNAGGDKVGRNDTFSSGLNLRGLGNSATLVLINGRRMAGSGAFGDFSDVSMIPAAAVERVEVLLDGASAVYGSDAVGGVVNIITRKNFSGGETRILGGLATTGQPGQVQVSQTLGKRWGSGDVVVAYEFQQRDALNGGDRGFSAMADLRALGGTDQRQTNSFPGNILIADPVTRVLTPAFAIPTGQNGINLLPGAFQAGVANRQNQRLGEDILPQQTLNSLYVSARQDLGDRLELSGDATYSYRRFKSHQPPATGTFTVNRGNPFFVSPVGAATDTVAYSFANDFPNPTTGGSVEDLVLSFGGNLRLFSDWRAEAYGTFAQAKADVRNHGLLNSLSLSEALGSVADRSDTAFSAARDGFFNPFSGIAGSNPSAVVAYISGGFIDNRSRDQVSSINLQADGTVWSLPGGPLKLALGAQARRESLYQTGVSFVSTAAPVAKAPNDLSRDVTAAFVEAQAPLFGAANARPGFQKLELSAAERVEHYQGIGTTANPKFGILWAPVEDLQLRATFGRSFRAPALRETSDAADFSPSLLNLGSAKVLSLILGGGNPNLRPETARSWTLGADFKPSFWPGLSIGLTGFDIRYHDRIDRPVQANLANALQDPTLASFVTRISPGSNPADLALITALLSSPALSTANGVFAATAYGGIADNRYVNTSTLQVRGVDLTAAYAFRVGDDDVSLTENASYLLNFDQQVTPTSPLLNRVNVVNFPLRFRSRATANWSRGRLTLTGAFNYAGAYRDALGVGIDAQPTFDAQVRLAPPERGLLKGVNVLLNIRNIFDRDPPFYNNTAGVGYDPASGDPIGRFVSIQLTHAW